MKKLALFSLCWRPRLAAFGLVSSGALLVACSGDVSQDSTPFTPGSSDVVAPSASGFEPGPSAVPEGGAPVAGGPEHEQPVNTGPENPTVSPSGSPTPQPSNNPQASPNPVNPSPTSSPGPNLPSTPGPQGTPPQNGEEGPTDEPVPPVSEDATAQRCSELGPGTHAGLSRLRRLTRSAFDNTVRDLLGIGGEPSFALGLVDESMGPFYSNGIAPVTDLLVQQHGEVAQQLAGQAMLQRNEIAGCDLDSGSACVAQFVQNFGLRAYRRPLRADEQAAFVNLFTTGQQEGGTAAGFSIVVETMLQSPYFLYLVETGVNGVPSVAPVLLSDYELATRLSYFLWDTMPDATLFGLAAQGQLSQPAVLAEQVDRMLADAKARDSIPWFHLQWLGLRGMESVNKDTTHFPQFTPDLRAAMLAETADFTDYVVRQGDGLMATLFSAPYSVFSSPALFNLYGVTPEPGAAPGATVALDPSQRAGVLTQAAFLTLHAHPEQTSPVHRGIVVRENLLCQIIPSPPPEVNNVAPSVVEGTTTRDRFARHSEDLSCGGCHILIDPIGLGFENYDPIGAWRTHEGELAIDASGEIIAAGDDIGGPFVGAVELAQRLAISDQAASCFANQWFRYALGRMESSDDSCTVTALHQGFRDSGGNIRGLLKDIATSIAFTHVRSVAEEAN